MSDETTNKKQHVADFIRANNPTPTGRASILKDATAAVLSDRNKQYGNPEDNFRNIADVWNWYLADKVKRFKHATSYRADDKLIHEMLDITPLDVAHLMVLMKMARLKTNPTHRDSIVDVAGYAACAGDFVSQPLEKGPTPNSESPTLTGRG